MKVLVTPSMEENRFCINRAYSNAILRFGGLPFLPAFGGSSQDPDAWLQMADGLLLSGGGDIHARFFHEELHPKANTIWEERDMFEIALCRRALAMDMPILAICRGMQVLNVAAGGGLIQHIDNHSYGDRRSEEVHPVSIDPDSFLYRLVRKNTLGVNSIHHQCIGKPGDGIITVALSPDGIPEAIEMRCQKLVLGVQWHPEALLESDPHAAIFKAFLSACD